MSEKKKAQQHALLAVAPELRGKAKRALEEMGATFTNKKEHFTGHEIEYKPFDEKHQNLAGIEERREVQTTVQAKMAYALGIVAQNITCITQIDLTNQHAYADLVIGDVVLGKSIPASTLLHLETKLIPALRAEFAKIPTLQPGKKWELDEGQGKNIYKTVHPDRQFRTQKMHKHEILVPATKEHPANVHQWTEDEKVGERIKNTWSGQISTAQKAELMEGLDKLSKAVKKARAEANRTEARPSDLGKKVTNYLLSNLK